MVDQKLVKYIEAQLKKGYSHAAIRNYLINYGYQPQNVDEAIYYIYNHPQSHNRFMIFLGVLALLLLASGIFYFMADSQPANFSYQLDFASTQIDQGNNLQYTNTFQFDGKRADEITLEYVVYDNVYKQKVDSFTEVISKDEEIDLIKTYDARRLEPGTYKFEITISYADKRKQFFKTFKVNPASNDITTGFDEQANLQDNNIPLDSTQENNIGSSSTQNQDTFTQESASCFDNIQNQGEIGVDCGGPCNQECTSCFDSIQNQDETGVDCGGVCIIPCEDEQTTQSAQSQGDDYETYDNAKIIANDEPTQGNEMCKVIADTNLKNDCHIEVSKIANSSVYCNEIITSSAKDSCLMYFVSNYDDFDACAGLQDDQFKSICKSLKDLKTIRDIKEQDKPEDEKNQELIDALGYTQIDENQDQNLNQEQPKITAVAAIPDTTNSVKISWTTSQEGDSTVYYGVDTNSMLTAFDGNPTSNHLVTVQPLDPNTQYIFKVRSIINNEVIESDQYYQFICCEVPIE